MLNQRVKGINSQYEYKRKFCLNAGQTARIYQGLDILRNRKVVVKVLTTEDNDRFNHQKEIFKILMEQGPFKYIVEIFDVIDNSKNEENELVIVMEYALGNLEDCLNQEKEQLDEQLKFCLGFQIIFGVYEIHQLGFMHRNIQPQNILYFRDQDDNIILKICGFGVACYFDESNDKIQNIGTKIYSAPEMKIDNFNYNYKVDIWSVGLVMYEINTFQKLNNISQEVKHLLEIMIMEKPENRSTIKQAFQTAYEILQQYNYNLNFQDDQKVHKALKLQIKDICWQVENINGIQSQPEQKNIILQINHDLQLSKNNQKQTLEIDESNKIAIYTSSQRKQTEFKNEKLLIEEDPKEHVIKINEQADLKISIYQIFINKMKLFCTMIKQLVLAHYYYHEGNELHNMKCYNDAIIYYDKAIRLRPKDPSYYNQKGIILFQLGKYEEAVICFDQAISISPKNPQYYYRKGNSLLKLQRSDDAILCYDKLISLNPKDSNNFYQKGIILYNLGRYDDAIRCYDQAIIKNPKNSLYYYNKGQNLHQQQRYEDAIKCYDQAIIINPKGSDYYNSKGTSLCNMKRYDDAIICYDQAISINPKNSNYYINKGTSLRNMKRYDDSITCYDQAIRINPKISNYYNDKGISLYDLQRYEDAIMCFDQAISIDSKSSNYYNNKGTSLRKMKRYDDAIMCFDLAISFNPKNCNCYNNKGISLCEMQRYNDAIICYDQAISINPTYSKLYLNKAQTLCYSGLNNEAVIQFDQAINLEKNQPQNQKKNLDQKINILMKLNRCDEAIAYQDQIFCKETTDYKLQKKLDLLYRFGHHNQALKHLDEVINNHPNNEQQYFQKAEYLEKLDRFNDAMDVYDQVNGFNTQSLVDYLPQKSTNLLNKSMYEQALIYFNKIIQIKPEKQDSYECKAKCLINLNRYDEAIICYDIILTLSPENEDAYFQKGKIFKLILGLCLKKLDYYDEAITCFDYLISRNPKKPNYYYQKGNCLYQNSMIEYAVKCYDQAICLDSQNKKFYHKKGIALINIGIYKEVYRCFQLALSSALNENQNRYNEIKQQVRQILH